MHCGHREGVSCDTEADALWPQRRCLSWNAAACARIVVVAIATAAVSALLALHHTLGGVVCLNLAWHDEGAAATTGCACVSARHSLASHLYYTKSLCW
mmetsp:Transcript_42282/g.91780  ORF Transcript_42282/g.91780 Transcript_42282/m.91780 type:complete len:98 (-) Transcript_42282:456-749(-)